MLVRVAQFSLSLLVPIAGYIFYYFVQGGELSSLLYWLLLFNFVSDYNEIGRLLPTSSDLLRMLPAFLLLIPFAAPIVKKNDLGIEQWNREGKIWILLLLLAAIVYLCLRYSIPHWTVAFPIMAMISGISLHEMLGFQRENGTRFVAQSFFAAILVWWVLQGSLGSWPFWIGNRVPELFKYDHLIELADILHEKIPEEGPITLLPDDESVSNLYYLLQRPPAFFWIMHYPWLINDRTTKQWLDAVEATQPQTVLFFDNPQAFRAVAPPIHVYVTENYFIQETFDWNGRSVTIMSRKN